MNEDNSIPKNICALQVVSTYEQTQKQLILFGIGLALIFIGSLSNNMAISLIALMCFGSYLIFKIKDNEKKINELKTKYRL